MEIPIHGKKVSILRQGPGHYQTTPLCRMDVFRGLTVPLAFIITSVRGIHHLKWHTVFPRRVIVLGKFKRPTPLQACIVQYGNVWLQYTTCDTQDVDFCIIANPGCPWISRVCNNTKIYISYQFSRLSPIFQKLLGSGSHFVILKHSLKTSIFSRQNHILEKVWDLSRERNHPEKVNPAIMKKPTGCKPPDLSWALFG